MKFDNHKYWKHDDCTDAFFQVISIAFDDNGSHARLYGCWMVQGTANYWHATSMEPINIKPKDYDRWKPYKPSGSYRY